MSNQVTDKRVFTFSLEGLPLFSLQDIEVCLNRGFPIFGKVSEVREVGAKVVNTAVKSIKREPAGAV